MQQSSSPEQLLAHALRTHPLLGALTPEQQWAVAEQAQLCMAAQGEVLLEQGRPGKALYLLLSGQCRAVHRHPCGHESEYPPLREGDIFGEISLLVGLSATATVQAVAPCVLLRLERVALEQHVLSQPGLQQALARLATERLERTARMVVEAHPQSGLT